MSRCLGIVADPLFVGMTRPPMVCGVTYAAMMFNIVVTTESFISAARWTQPWCVTCTTWASSRSAHPIRSKQHETSFLSLSSMTGTNSEVSTPNSMPTLQGFSGEPSRLQRAMEDWLLVTRNDCAPWSMTSSHLHSRRPSSFSKRSPRTFFRHAGMFDKQVRSPCA